MVYVLYISAKLNPRWSRGRRIESQVHPLSHRVVSLGYMRSYVRNSKP